jgi:hypothetical protein
MGISLFHENSIAARAMEGMSKPRHDLGNKYVQYRLQKNPCLDKSPGGYLLFLAMVATPTWQSQR